MYIRISVRQGQMCLTETERGDGEERTMYIPDLSLSVRQMSDRETEIEGGGGGKNERCTYVSLSVHQGPMCLTERQRRGGERMKDVLRISVCPPR